ncbi:MAG: trypsin-like peptidase domain-containing protein [Candidatus Bathyarchaeota archaeon]
MESPEVNKKAKISSNILAVIILASLFAGAIGGYYLGSTPISNKIHKLENEISTLNQRIDNLQKTSVMPSILDDNVSLPLLFDQIRQSVVVVEGLIPHRDFFGRIYYTQDQGSGFICNFGGQVIILTNYHVVADTTSINVTFINGQEYPASIIGSNPNADLALLSTDASMNDFNTLEIVGSSTLRVGDSVIVVGTPYGLEGTMSVGIVSALNRTLSTEDYTIGNVIQTTAPLNPGNSGGPLLNYQGQVVGIVTAIVQESQGIGFAIPSDTILENVEEIL